MTEAKPAGRWSIEQRLEFIEFRLFWEGTIRRIDIRRKFSVSLQQASIDINKYRDLAPDNLFYDASDKRYYAAKGFKPLFHKPNPGRYLAQLRAITEDVISEEETMIGSLPDCDVLPIPARTVSASKLRKILQAIRTQQSIMVEYQSMNDARPEPLWRTITPHAIASDGLRWHARAYCHLEERFKDFIISRCLRIGKVGDSHPINREDADWNCFFDVILAPNPALGVAQQRTIEIDYGMKDGSCTVRVRRALLYYFDKRMRLDVSAKHDRPKETPLIVKNRKDYDAALSGSVT
ncbi:WYL domain-containing protein [Marinicaulis aureus]|uniref:WYL domain-containing protein n=1 Tax=Hyphococcus aureus TaxID=2666033 RepID=A0ABW1KWC7_9PROT